MEEKNETEVNTASVSGKRFTFLPAAFGALFFADFNLGVFDILPDFPGAVLLLAAIGGASVFCGYFKDAVRQLKILLAVLSIKFIFNFAFAVFGIQVKNASDILLFTTVFSLLEALLLIPAVLNIKRGLVVYLNLSESFKTAEKLSLAANIFCVFLVVKNGAAILLRAPVLLDDNTLDLLSDRYNIYLTPELITESFFFPAVFTAALFAVFALSLLFPAFIEVSRDKRFLAVIGQKHAEFLAGAPFFTVSRDISLAFLFLILGAASNLDFFIDGINLIPEFLPALFFSAGAGILKRHNQVPPGYFKPVNNAFLAISALSFAAGILAFHDGLYMNDAASEIFLICFAAFKLVSVILLPFLIVAIDITVENTVKTFAEYFDAHRPKAGDKASPRLKIYAAAVLAAKALNISPPANEVFLIAVNAAFAVCLIISIIFLMKKRDAIIDLIPA